MLLSNCSSDRGSLSIAWVGPFDLLARGNERRQIDRGHQLAAT
jgi:hypothetical protein